MFTKKVLNIGVRGHVHLSWTCIDIDSTTHNEYL